MRGRPILALVFVALTAIVLTIPLRGLGDEGSGKAAGPTKKSEKPSESPTPETSPTPDATPTPEESPTPEDSPTPDEVATTARFEGDYPQDCLAPIDPPADDGLLAIDQGSQIEITDVNGSGSASVEAEFPLRWSPSGEYFMTASGIVYDKEGNEGPSLLNLETTSYWGWSPVADCLLTSDGTALSVFVPGGGRETLHGGPITRFAFSPGGGDIAFVQEDADDEASLWVASLANGKANRIADFELGSDEEIVLAGWTPDARHVLYWQGSPDAVLEDRKLQAVSATGKVTELATVLAHRDFLASCDDELFAIVGGGARVEKHPKRLAVLTVGSAPRILTPAGSQDIGVTCAPAGNFIATVRTPDVEGRGPGALTVMDLDGTEVYSVDDPSFKDAYAVWGRGGAGLLFVRQSLEGGKPVLWHIPEGGSPAPTGITLDGIDHKPGTLRDSWGRWISWSADQPNGVHSTSGAS